MSTIKKTIKDLCPPIAWETVKKIKFLGRNEFEGNYPSWGEAKLAGTGYDANFILDRILNSALKVKNGDKKFERDSVLFEQIQYSFLVSTALMWAAALDAGVLNVLDFGGSLGTSYFQNKRFLTTLREVKWNVVEQPHYVEAGQRYIQDETIRFYKSIDECLFENKPNIIVLSSVLQYLEFPKNLFDQLASVGGKVMVVDKTPFSDLESDAIVLQNVPSSIYPASYPMWVLSEAQFNQMMEINWNIIVTDINKEGFRANNNGLKFCFKGMLCEAKNLEIKD